MRQSTQKAQKKNRKGAEGAERPRLSYFGKSGRFLYIGIYAARISTGHTIAAKGPSVAQEQFLYLVRVNTRVKTKAA